MTSVKEEELHRIRNMLRQMTFKPPKRFTVNQRAAFDACLEAMPSEVREELEATARGTHDT